MSTPSRQPALFIGHGSPMNTLEVNQYTQAWRALAANLAKIYAPPKAILAISAHWQTRGVAVTAMQHPETIHDFGGFPQALFDYLYPAPGNPALAQRIITLLQPLKVIPTQDWGLDHGTWSVLAHLFPQANIPVVQLSMDATQPAQFHYQLGQRLRALRDEGILIVCSGNVVHNLRMMQMHAAPAEWASRFEAYVHDHIARREHASLINFSALGRDAQLSIPSDEHYLPLLYLLGLQHDIETARFPVQGIAASSLSMLSVQVG